MAPVAFYTLDKGGRICQVNETGAKFLGFSQAWLLRRPFVVFVAKEHVASFITFLLRAGQPDAPSVTTIDLNISGSIYPVQISVSKVTEGSNVIHRLAVLDLKDLRNTERVLRESLANWYWLVHSAPDTIMTIEESGRIVFVNKPLWGYSVPAVTGTNLFDYIPARELVKVRHCVNLAFRRNQRSVCEITGLDQDSSSWYSLSFGAHQDREVKEINPVASVSLPTTTLLIREISESKRTEEKLRTSGEELRDFAARLDAVREEERTRVAREIHDELGQALTALRLDLSWLQKKRCGAGESRKKLNEMIRQVDETIESVRRIASELRPSILDNLGLIAAIEWQAAEFRKRTRMRTTVVSNVETVDLPLESSIAMFRVVQEALTNVMRHARASKVEIVLRHEDDLFRISVTDNGIGVTLGQKKDLKSLGIVGMKERVARIGGDFNFLSERGKGTRIEIVIPVPS